MRWVAAPVEGCYMYIVYNYCFRKALLRIIIALFIHSVGVLILLLLAD